MLTFLREHASKNSDDFFYLMYPSGNEPIETIWKGKVLSKNGNIRLLAVLSGSYSSIPPNGGRSDIGCMANMSSLDMQWFLTKPSPKPVGNKVKQFEKTILSTKENLQCQFFFLLMWIICYNLLLICFLVSPQLKGSWLRNAKVDWKSLKLQFGKIDVQDFKLEIQVSWLHCKVRNVQLVLYN